jgi:hypothetical protein
VRALNGRINEFLDRVTLADLLEGRVADHVATS